MFAQVSGLVGLRLWQRCGKKSLSRIRTWVSLGANAPRHSRGCAPTAAAADFVMVSYEAFTLLDDALAALANRGVDTDASDAIWKSENPF